jgi:uncharacterized protein (TIGR03000 family)
MIRSNWKCLVIGAVMAVALSASAPKADAWCGRGCGGGWGCGWPYASCCGYWGGYGGWRTCGWGCGYACGCGCYSGWYGGCCGGSYVSTFSSCCGGTTIAPSTPTIAPQSPTPAQRPIEPTPAPAAPPPGKTSATSAENSGILTVWVPYDAKVTVNGLETSSMGSRRQFVSYGLQSGLSYKYVVRAQVIRNGQVQDDTRTVTLTAGEVTAVAFGFNATGSQVAAAQ